LAQQEHIFRIIRTEYYVKNFALHKPPNIPSHDVPLEEKYIYHVDSTGATITAGCCVNLIYKYCEKLPKDRYYLHFHVIIYNVWCSINDFFSSVWMLRISIGFVAVGG
jgi:hypothetical protein